MPLHQLQRSKLSTMKRNYQSSRSSTSESESDSDSDSDCESEILTLEILCEVGLNVAQFVKTDYNKEPMRPSVLSGVVYIKEILTCRNPRRALKVLRMSGPTFRTLCQWFCTKGLLRDTRNVTVEEEVVMFMAVVGKGNSNRDTQETFRHSGRERLRVGAGKTLTLTVRSALGRSPA
ncbi:hypothetical protein FN846DRAFT_1012413 [Sphaerosporella brunnea]|uniref:DUF8040 domain-containing protein n=1 Tax=Sphaerosporella brunnea TaxID=1250544 RepID=A0A5J5EYJ0_9PEZI|nr:hypothetical protein FN846DRAFT_1012413 [Sphaerosporella brunnea]